LKRDQRSKYDTNVYLKRIVDVNGKAVEMAYDTASSKQTVKDQLGNPTTYFYDDRGNVTREIDAEGKITDRTYDDNTWVLSETVISDRSALPISDRKTASISLPLILQPGCQIIDSLREDLPTTQN
jgi:YD repeat-containing protein